MKYFIDTEFIEDFTHPWLGKSRHYIDLISIGIVAEDGREYYAVSNEFDINHVWTKYQIKELNIGTGAIKKEYWLRDNVLMPIFYEMYLEEYTRKSGAVTLEMFKNDHVWSTDLHAFKFLIRKYGKSNKQIAQDITRFVFPAKEEITGWQGDFPMYHKVYGSPEFYGYYADYDWVLFCSLYGRMLDLPKGFPKYCNDLKQMLEEKNALLKQNRRFNAYLLDYPKQTNEHNALADARWNRDLYNFLQSI